MVSRTPIPASVPIEVCVLPESAERQVTEIHRRRTPKGGPSPRKDPRDRCRPGCESYQGRSRAPRPCGSRRRRAPPLECRPTNLAEHNGRYRVVTATPGRHRFQANQVGRPGDADRGGLELSRHRGGDGGELGHPSPERAAVAARRSADGGIPVAAMSGTVRLLSLFSLFGRDAIWKVVGGRLR